MKTLIGNRKVRSIAILFAITLFVHILDSRGHLFGLQMAFGPDLMLQRGAQDTPLNLAIVRITDDDYQEILLWPEPS